jgi:hypothetical protein
MSRYDGLIIPRSYSEYINKTDAATLQQALQISGVLSNTVIAGDNKAVKSDAVNTALENNYQKKDLHFGMQYNVSSKTISGLKTFKAYILSMERDGSNTAGLYFITRGSVNPIINNTNYTVTENNGTLTINKSIGTSIELDFFCFDGDYEGLTVN